jgi:hypothetical protein
MRRRLALMIALGTTLLLSEPDAGVERTRHLRQSYQRARRELTTHYADWMEAADAPAFPRALNRAWWIAGEWAAAFLNAHPRATARQLAGAIVALDPPRRCADADGPCFDEYHLCAHAVRLDEDRGEAYAVDVNYPRSGTFFVIARDGRGPFHVAWTIKDLADRHYALRDDIGKWAWVDFPWNDGPLIGTVGALPKSGPGQGRFYVDASAAPLGGGTYPNQISIWEWNGREAVPLFVESYSVSFDTSPLAVHGGLLEIQTKGDYKQLSSCGMCPEPRVHWRLMVGPYGVRDLGRRHLVPELEQVDELWDRLVRGKPADTIAAPSVSRALEPLIREMRADAHSDRDLSLGMLGDWKVTTKNGRSRIDLDTDHLICNSLHFEAEPRGPPYLTAAEIVPQCK